MARACEVMAILCSTDSDVVPSEESIEHNEMLRSLESAALERVASGALDGHARLLLSALREAARSLAHARSHPTPAILCNSTLSTESDFVRRSSESVEHDELLGRWIAADQAQHGGGRCGIVCEACDKGVSLALAPNSAHAILCNETIPIESDFEGNFVHLIGRESHRAAADSRARRVRRTRRIRAAAAQRASRRRGAAVVVLANEGRKPWPSSATRRSRVSTESDFEPNRSITTSSCARSRVQRVRRTRRIRAAAAQRDFGRCGCAGARGGSRHGCSSAGWSG